MYGLRLVYQVSSLRFRVWGLVSSADLGNAKSTTTEISERHAKAIALIFNDRCCLSLRSSLGLVLFVLIARTKNLLFHLHQGMEHVVPVVKKEA